MYIHVFYFQKYEKITKMNEKNEILILKVFFQNIILNDGILIINNYLSNKYTDLSKIVKFAVIPIFQFILSIIIFNPICIEGYYKTFFLCKSLWFLSNFIKSLVTAISRRFIVDIIKLIDTILIINIILIAITDPLYNDEDNNNKVVFYEIYFRYLEYHILMLALTLIYNDRNIEEDVKDVKFTTSAVIGKYDSFKFSCILIISHYYFPLVNGIAYSFKYD